MSDRVYTCPHCGVGVYCDGHRYRLHSLTPGSWVRCPLSYQRREVTGFTEADYEARAKLVTDLAQQVQDCDPGPVYQYLTALPEAEKQRLLMIALAAIPLDRTLNELFGWVINLPAAKVSA